MPDQAGTGIGTALLDAVGPVDRLWVLAGDSAGREWYARRGWVASGAGRRAADVGSAPELLYERQPD